MRSVIALLVFCFVFLFTTCATVPILQEPVVSLHSVQIAKLDILSGAQLLCKVQVENPNGFTIPLPEVGWEVFLNTNSFVNGVIKDNQQIKAKNSSIVEIPVNLNYLDIFKAFASLKGKKQTDYKAVFNIKFAIPLLGDKIWHLEHEGNLPIPQLPKISAPVMRVEKTDLTMVEWLVSFNVENPNPFELPQPKITFNYQIDNRSFIQNTLANKGALAASSVTPVAFGLVVYYADLFRVFSNLRNSANVQSQLDITFDFGVPVFSGENFNLHIPASLPLSR
ncbi:MAG: LEA type 2 family protein [Bacteroidetes bacterium]|nr:LEA type 2 family protein [Bacteroidota bacterium]